MTWTGISQASECPTWIGGTALKLANSDYTRLEGNDGGSYNCDTVEEFNLHGDPAFNPYEPNNNG